MSEQLRVTDCKAIAEKWKKHMVIVIAIDCEAEIVELASYGDSPERDGEARQLAVMAVDKVTENWL